MFCDLAFAGVAEAVGGGTGPQPFDGSQDTAIPGTDVSAPPSKSRRAGSPSAATARASSRTRRCCAFRRRCGHDATERSPEVKIRQAEHEATMADNRRSPTCFALELSGWAYGVHRLVKHRSKCGTESGWCTAAGTAGSTGCGRRVMRWASMTARASPAHRDRYGSQHRRSSRDPPRWIDHSPHPVDRRSGGGCLA